jgi:hypothetical protein
MDIQFCRRLLGRVRGIRFSADDYVDLSDRLALLTVAAGIRGVAGFGFNEFKDEPAQLPIKKILEGEGLSCVVTGPIYRPVPREQLPADISAVFEETDKQLDRHKNERLLWSCSDASKINDVLKVISGEKPAGLVLGYPPCCVEHDCILHDLVQTSFRKAIIEKVGTGLDAVRAALRDDLKVSLPIDPYKNSIATLRSYPFVFHIACDECLADGNPASSQLNQALGALARDVDRCLHQGISDLARIEADFRVAGSEAEAMAFSRGHVDDQTKGLLDSLFRKRTRAYERAMAP